MRGQGGIDAGRAVSYQLSAMISHPNREQRDSVGTFSFHQNQLIADSCVATFCCCKSAQIAGKFGLQFMTSGRGAGISLPENHLDAKETAP